MSCNFAVIGVGNMAKAIISGILKNNLPIEKIYLYDKLPIQYNDIPDHSDLFCIADSVPNAVAEADYVLLSVKPQNYEEVLQELVLIPNRTEKVYISIGAGITSASVSERLGGACVIRVLPNVPMFIGMGVSLICETSKARPDDFAFVTSVFRSAGSTLIIDECEMNRMIGVTSSSPAYVFQFIQSIYEGALAQGLSDRDLLSAICDVVIGSAQLLKQSNDTPKELISKVASKGGTTEQALQKLEENHFNETICQAMLACTCRAEELGQIK
ncbi:MAG: pyrroline-5-carboxylate reductase [Clostridia bacterium]|nr:pyrroline-5-carboxylate reductase [Clostridia bacterium]